MRNEHFSLAFYIFTIRYTPKTNIDILIMLIGKLKWV